MVEEYIRELVQLGIRSGDPRHILPQYLRLIDNCVYFGMDKFCLDKGRVYVVGAGKASGSMAVALEDIMGDLIEEGVVSIPSYMMDQYKTRRIELIGAGHPVPDENSIRAAEKMMDIAGKADENDLLIALISGGGSALMEKPLEPITLEELRYTTKLLLNSGADIREINIVRKHLSMVKGGRLVEKTRAGRVYGILISDVPGDYPEYIASGPTVPDPSTYRDAVSILKRYKLWDKIPGSVRRVLEEGLRGGIPETPKPGDPVFNRVVNKIIASNLMALEKLGEKLRRDGYKVLILTSRIEGESREVGKALASIALEAQDKGYPANPPLAILVGGETTVTVRKSGGRGGRCQELVLSLLASIRDREGIVALSYDTDGIDGLSDVAGAYVDHNIWLRMIDAGDNPYRYLDENNSYEFFKRYGGHIFTGPTGTNINTITIILVNPRALRSLPKDPFAIPRIGPKHGYPYQYT